MTSPAPQQPPEPAPPPPPRRRVRAATFPLLRVGTFAGLAAFALLLCAGAGGAFATGQGAVGMTVALPALFALLGAFLAFRACRTSVSVDTDGIRFRQGGRVRAILSWSDYAGWRQEGRSLLLLRDREEPLSIPTYGVRNAWAGLTAALDEIRPNAAADPPTNAPSA